MTSVAKRKPRQRARRASVSVSLVAAVWGPVRQVLIFLAAVIVVCGAVHTALKKTHEAFFAPVDAADASPVPFTVRSGSSLGTVSQALEDAGLIHNHTVFKYMADFMGMGQRIQSGRYQLSRAMDTRQILDQLVAGDGRPVTTTMTIIPGWTVRDVAAYLVESGVLTDTSRFLSLCQSGEGFAGYDFMDAILQEGNRGRLFALEGYLSPNTYEIYTDSSEETLIRKLLNQTAAAYQAAYDERAGELGMTMDQVFTLASMIEKEAKTQDFSRVSAVFHNRLKSGMTLDSDATVKYASGSQKMALSSQDLQAQTPYNTYRVKGLPPGPICNPSMDAVVAALYPDESFVAKKYLYFCSTDPASGTLHFSRSLQEHEAAVSMYRPMWEEYDRSRGLN